MSKKKATSTSLPLSRTAKIMTSAVGVESVNNDIVALATKATEIFLMDFAQRAYDQSSGEEFRSNVLEYEDIHKLVHSDSRYDFLADSIPKRIKFSEALKLVQAANEAEKIEMQRRKEFLENKAREDEERKRKKLELEKEKLGLEAKDANEENVKESESVNQGDSSQDDQENN